MKASEILEDLINTGKYRECARQAHVTWRATKEAQGWKYGDKRDTTAKTNHLMVPFEQLPKELQGQNSLTPYAVVNYLRVMYGDMEAELFKRLVQDFTEGKKSEEVEKLGEYVHSHFIAGQLTRGETTETRKDMVVYNALDAETKSWDTKPALEVMKYVAEHFL